MTIFGIDISYYQNGLSLVAAKQAGVDFAIIRTNDGGFKDPCYRSHVDDGRQAGMLLAAYVYVRPPSSISLQQQVQTTLEVMGDHHRLPIWLDVECHGGYRVEWIRQIRDLYEAAGIRVIGCYSYVPYWENQIAPAEPDSHEFGHFWVAGYPYGGKRPYRERYAMLGDEHRQWGHPLGNQLPSLWQYTSEGTLPGWGSGVDCNAFRGTLAELSVIFNGVETHKGEEEMTQEQANRIEQKLDLLLDQLAGPGRDANGLPSFEGWPQLEGKTLVDALAVLLKDKGEK